MAYTELDLAQLERRLLAGERCVSRQRELLHHHIAARLPTDEPLEQLVAFEATLVDLRRSRNRIRDEITAARMLRMLDGLVASTRGARHRDNH